MMIAALDEYTEACDALKAELGIPEHDDMTDNLWDAIAEIADRMKTIEPTTIPGLQAKAKMLFYWYWAGDEDESRDGRPITVEIIKALANQQLVA